MLKNTVKTIAAAGILAVGATLATAGSASAGTVGVYFGNGNGGIYLSDGIGHRVHHRHRLHRRHGICTPRRALNKAWRMGVNRPYIDRIGYYRIVVKGFKYGHRAKVTFNRHRPRCPVINTRGLH